MYSKRNKYEPLGEYLQKTKKDEITLTFSQIEEIIEDNLPVSASKYQAWWVNGGHAHSDAWTEYGYKTSELDLAGRKVTFIKG